jgi:hypothetical protein
MSKTAPGGALLAVAALLLVGLGPVLGLGAFRAVVTGLAVGCVLGCVPHGSVLVAPDRLMTTGSTAARAGAWLGGLAAAAVGYAVYLQIMPDTAWSRALVVTAVVLVLAGVATVSGGRVPLWALTLGAASLLMAGPAPVDVEGFTSGEVTALTSLAIAAALGLLIGSAGQWVSTGAPVPPPAQGDPAVPEFIRRNWNVALGQPIPGPRESRTTESTQEQA